MGSWYKTCGLSNLPILTGDRTYVFVMEQNSSEDNHCYSSHLYRPVLLSFESTYADYGAGESSSGIGLDLIMSGIKDRMIEIPQGENKYHDIPVTKEAFDEELFFESIREGRLKVKSYNGENRVEFTMLRKDVVDAILETYIIEKYVGEGKGNTGYKNSYINYQFADLVKEVPAAIAAIKEHGVLEHRN
jgi:hypothetical protein